jgi:hypothetical protein
VARPTFVIVKGSELSLSGPALVKLLRAVLDKGAPVRFSAKGFSMSPFIKNEDVVTLSPLQDASPSVGDVIAFLGRRGLLLPLILTVWKVIRAIKKRAPS